MSGMIFEWNEAKDIANQRKHGISFDRAIRTFDDPLRVTVVERIENGEVRWQIFGIVDQIVVLMVAHTITDAAEDLETIRLISARRANKQERWRYENENG